MKSIKRRFWEKVDVGNDDDCWEWRAAKNTKGYGRFGLSKAYAGKKTHILAHRMAWLLTKGEIPEHDSFHGMCVLHKCDNPACVNPGHLFLGTNQDNVLDMVNKGRRIYRGLHGEDNPAAKLSVDKVGAIRKLLNAGKSQRKIAAMFDVGKSTIARIGRGTHWQGCQAGGPR